MILFPILDVRKRDAFQEVRNSLWQQPAPTIASPWSADGNLDRSVRWRWEHRLGSGRDWDLRLLYEEAGAARFTAAASIYF